MNQTITYPQENHETGMDMPQLRPAQRPVDPLMRELRHLPSAETEGSGGKTVHHTVTGRWADLKHRRSQRSTINGG